MFGLPSADLTREMKLGMVVYLSISEAEAGRSQIQDQSGRPGFKIKQYNVGVRPWVQRPGSYRVEGLKGERRRCGLRCAGL